MVLSVAVSPERAGPWFDLWPCQNKQKTGSFLACHIAEPGPPLSEMGKYMNIPSRSNEQSILLQYLVDACPSYASGCK